MKKTIIALAITGSIVISGVVAVAAQNSNKQDVLSSQEISKKALSYVKGKVYKIELEQEKSGPVYEIDVKGTKAEYELKLDAKTGELLKKSTKYNTSNLTGKKIGIARAKQIALNSVKGKIRKAKLDKEDNIYEIEIIKGKYEYEFDINAYTGKILKKDKEKITSAKKGNVISLRRAKQIALRSVNGVVQQAQYNQNNGLYEIHIVKNSKTYKLNIDAHTGAIINQRDGNSVYTASIGNIIGLEEAKQIALNAVGGVVTSANLDSEDGVYDVEVQSGEFEYEFEINAHTGAIVKQQKESTSQTFASIGANTISMESAKQIALSKVSGTILSANYEQASNLYEISISANGYEYEFDINAQTGAIVKQDQEPLENTATNNDAAIISSQKASQIALSKAKGTVTKIDLEEGIYEVEVKDGTYEYEIEIDAKTGDILSFDKEYED